jgi:hypothetical protein
MDVIGRVCFVSRMNVMKAGMAFTSALLLASLVPAEAASSAYALSSLKALPPSRFAPKTVSLRTDGAQPEQSAVEDSIEWNRMGLVAQVYVPEEAFVRAASRRVITDLNLRAAVDDDKVAWHKLGFVGGVRIPSHQMVRPKRVDLSPAGISGVVGGILDKQQSQQQQRRARRAQAAARDIRFAMMVGRAKEHGHNDADAR